MKLKTILLLFIFFVKVLHGQERKKVFLENETLILDKAIELHLTDSIEPIRKSKIDLKHEDAWLFFDNLKPSEVARKYIKSITIKGAGLQLSLNGNARLAIYKQGAVLIPHDNKYQALQTFDQKDLKGQSMFYNLHTYYTNTPSKGMPVEFVKPMGQDNKIQSFKLKKGYMATFATEPNGQGYSRVFVADRGDLTINELPSELIKKISFIRVFQWNWPSKKGWCGGRGDEVGNSAINRQDNEISLTRSTWFYSWGLQDPYNLDAEFVPMKWGYGGNLNELNKRKDVTHLLGHNEPNRPDQSNISVDQVIEEWPMLLESGLRVGSPSVSDNSRLEDWLYKFIDECDRRNYRVDYVAVHAYWGAQQMPTPEDWYRTLKGIYLRTKRPIWLTEWNIGANWTKESWPADQKQQFIKQERDLKKILQMLDTASFVERYSIYNWVEDKRAIIIDSHSTKEVNGKQVNDKLLTQELTLAGKLYRKNEPCFAYNSKMQFIPKVNFYGKLLLTYDLSERDEIQLHWTTVGSSEMVKYFVVERSTDNNSFEEVGRITPPEKNLYFEALRTKQEMSSKQVYYRVRIVDQNGKQALLSNIVKYSYLDNHSNHPSTAILTNRNQWAMFLFENAYQNPPFLITGVVSNQNKMSVTQAIRNLGSSLLEFKFDNWKYQKDPNFVNEDTVALITFPSGGNYDFKGVKVLVGRNNAVNTSWTKVKFDKKFSNIPVVFATRTSYDNQQPAVVRIRKVTEEGFEICLQYEQEQFSDTAMEQVDFVAAEPGQGELDGRKIVVGLSDTKVGGYFKPASVPLQNAGANYLVWSFMQSDSDGIPASLRIKSQRKDSIEIYKEKELSKPSKVLASEQFGWMIIENK